MLKAPRIAPVTSGIYENESIFRPQQNNNQFTSHYALPDTIDNAPRSLIRSNSNQSSRPGSRKSLSAQNFPQVFIKANNTNNPKEIASISSAYFSDDEQETISTTNHSEALIIKEYEHPTELLQSISLKKLLLKHIEGPHRKKHIKDIEAALNEYFSSNTISSKKNSGPIEERIKYLCFTNLDHLKGFLDALLKKHKTKGKMYQLVATFIDNDEQLKTTLAINTKTPLQIKFIDNRPPIEPPFLAALSNPNKGAASITPSPSLIENNQSLPDASDASDALNASNASDASDASDALNASNASNASSIPPKKDTQPPLEKIDFSELNAQLKELLLAYIADTNNTKKHRGNIFTALNGKYGIKTVKSALEVETLIHSLDIQHIDQLGSILNLLLCARNPTRPFATSIQQLVETHPLLRDVFQFRIEKNHLVLGSRFALTPTSLAEFNQSEGISPQGIEALLSTLNVYYAESKHTRKLDVDLENEPDLHRFLMRDRLPLIGEPSPKLIWVGSGPTKSAELDQLFDNFSKYHGKNSSLLKLIRPIYEQYFPMTEIGKKAIQVENFNFKNAREKAIKAAVKLDTWHIPNLNNQGKKYEQAKADFKNAWLMHLSARDPQKNFERDVLPALKSFANKVLKTEIAIASFEANQNEINKNPLNANAINGRHIFKKLRHKAPLSDNTSRFKDSVEQLAKKHQEQLSKELNNLISSTTVQEKIKEKADKARAIAHDRFQKELPSSTNPFVHKNSEENLLSEHIQAICSGEHIPAIKQMTEEIDANFAKAVMEAMDTFSLHKAIDASSKECDAATTFKTWQASFRDVVKQQKNFQETILGTAKEAISRNHISQVEVTELLDAIANSQSINSAAVKNMIRQQLIKQVSELLNDNVMEKITNLSSKGSLHQRTEKIHSLVGEHLAKIEAARTACAYYDLNLDDVSPNNARDVVTAAYKNLPKPLGFRGTLTRTWRGLIAALGIGGASAATAGGLLLGFGGAAMAALGGATLGIGLAVIGGIAILAAGGFLIKKLYDAFQEKTFFEKEKNEFRKKYADYLEESRSPSLRNEIPLISEETTI